MKVRDFMTHEVATVRTGATFRAIVELMRAERVSGLPVVDEHGEVLGVVTQSDLLLKEHRSDHVRFHPPFSRGASDSGEAHRRTEGRLAGELMTSPALTVDQDAELRLGARLLTQHAIGRLPVTTGGKLVGILSRGDVLQAFLRPDADIEREIVDDVLGSKVSDDAPDVYVEVRDGVVTLRGWVERLSTARLIAFHVDRLDGVTRVDNQLRHSLDDLATHEPSRLPPVGPLEQVL